MSQKFEADRLQPREEAISLRRPFPWAPISATRGTKFVDRFDANSYLTLSLAMDLFDLGGTPEQLAASFRSARCRWLVLIFQRLAVSANQSRHIVDAWSTTTPPSATATFRAIVAMMPFCCRTILTVTVRWCGRFVHNLVADAGPLQAWIRRSCPEPSAFFTNAGWIMTGLGSRSRRGRACWIRAVAPGDCWCGSSNKTIAG